ncbi:uncharacterized protein LOC144098568 [Amblyomma americanum]
MLPIAAVVLAVTVFLLSVGTLTWLYFRQIRQMTCAYHKGSYKPCKTEELVLGRPVRLLSGSTKAAASDETDTKDVEAGGETTAGSGVVLLSVTPRKPEAESSQHKSATQFDQSKSAADGYSPGSYPVTSTTADIASACPSTSPRTQRANAARELIYNSSPEAGATQDHHQPLVTSCAGIPRCQTTCLNEKTTNDTVCTKTDVAHHGESENDSEEQSSSPMLWDYAGFKWPGKNREDVFTMDEYGHTDSDYSGTNDYEEDSDCHSSTSGVHHCLRKTQRSNSCYSFVEHCPEQLQNHRCVQLVPPECTMLHRGAASSGSLLVSDEDEADQAFFGKAQHDETYRQYLESIILKRKARMYYGQYAYYP